ncbi:MAG TPA: transcription termination/antitermination NusG family protein [Chthoniobacterales bacterium]
MKSQPKREHIAAAHLRQLDGVEVFCPRLRFQRPTVRGLKWFHEAMFPGYLFARFDFLQLKEVRYSSGVSAVLQFGGCYATLDDDTIESLRSRTDAQQVALVESRIKEGDVVEIVEGALQGLEAVVTEVLPGSERVKILLNFLGREIHAETQTPRLLPPRKHPMAA